MEYKPHDYQQFAINYILEHPIAAVILGMPFTFADVLILRYLMGVVDENQTVKDFDLVNNSSNLNWTFRSQVTKFIKRFIKDPYRNEDTEWIRKLSETYEFSIKAKLSALSKLL